MSIVIGIDPSFRGFGVSDGKRHAVFATVPLDSDETQAQAISRRCRTIIAQLYSFVAARTFGENEPVIFYIEAPAFGQQSQASHLYELGWLMRELHNLGDEGFDVEKVVEVSTTAVRKWATGKGNTPKDCMKLAVYKKFGVEFENDSGCDKLFAFLLCKYGQAVESGEIAFTPSAKRGQKRRKKIPS